VDRKDRFQDKETAMMRNGLAGWRSVALAVVLGASTLPARGADEPNLAEYYGFQPLEIYKLDSRIGGLQVRDFNGDKTDDILVVNNGRSRIDFLLSGKPDAADEPDGSKPEANQIVGDRRMRTVSLPVNKEVVSLQTGDFNGDGKIDIAYYGTPAELIVAYNTGKGTFIENKRINTGEAVESGTALTVGDLNKDGRDDLALLTPNEVILVLQRADGKLADLEHLPHTSANPRILKAVDVDGDGGDDLVLLEGGNDDPIRIRFSAEGGKLGPEERFAIEPPRAIAFGNLDGRPGRELLTIEAQSGRAKVLTLDDSEDAGAGPGNERRGRLIFYPLPRGEARNRSLALGDLDGDGKIDVVVSDPANAQFLIYRQGKGGLGTPQTFPSLSGGKTVRAADFDGDGKAEVIVLSESEKQIAHSVLADGRLSFPKPLPTSGDPVTLDVADLDGDKVAEILYVVPSGKDEGNNDVFSLRALKREKTGTFIPYRWGQDDSVVLKGVKSAPAALRVLDVNGDGQVDILAINSYGPPVLLLGRVGEPPAAVAGSLGPLVGATAAGLSSPSRGSAGLMVAQGTYAREVALDKTGQWSVADQFNAGRSSAQIIGAASIDTNGDKETEVVLLDKTTKTLLFLDKKDGVYRPGGSLSIGPIDFQGMHVADLDGDGRDDLLLAGSDRFGVVLTGRKGQRFKALAGYEPTRKDAVFADLVIGDLNGDGSPDIVLTDTNEHFVEIVASAQNGTQLDRALSFKVFERKSFRDADRLTEPRDLALGDVNGDGLTDLVLIVHDRVLVYRQDPGTSPVKPVASKP
jgi:hypothetical protein